MFCNGDKVIYHGGGNGDIVPIGTEGTVMSIKSSGNYIVNFKDYGYCTCKETNIGNSFLLHDRVKIIGPVCGISNEFFGFEGTVIELSSKKVIRIHLEFNTGPRDLFVETSSLERIESTKGSRWWV